jgi:hypothetical protein
VNAEDREDTSKKEETAVTLGVGEEGRRKMNGVCFLEKAAFVGDQ